MAIARTGPLTWAQHIFWVQNIPLRPDRGWQPVFHQPLTLPDGTTTTDLARALGECAVAFEALRTVYSTPGTQPPEQRVLDHYEPPLLDWDEAAQLCPITDRPSFLCAVRTKGRLVTEAKLTANMIDVDGYSMSALQRMIEHRLAGRTDPAAVARAAAVHPVDVALHEASGRYARMSERGLQWMREVRSTMPRNLIPVVRNTNPPGTILTAAMQDPVLLREVEELADGCGVSAATVFHAVIALVLAAWADRPDMYLSTAASNRWRRDTRHVIGRIASAVHCRLPVPPSDTATRLLKRCHEILLQAYRNGSRDVGACTMAGASADARYGSMLIVPVFVEYLGYVRDDPEYHHAILAQNVRTEFKPGSFDKVQFNIGPAWPGVEIKLLVDSAVLPESDAVKMLNLIVNSIRRIARRPDLPVAKLRRDVTLPSSSNADDWVTLDGSRFAASQIRRQLLAYPGVAHAALFYHDTLPPALHAHVSGSDTDLSGLHEHMLAAASRNTLIRVPTSYRAVRHLPADPASEAGWQAVGLSGELVPEAAYRRSPDDDERIRAMVAVFCECNPDRPCDPSRSYAQLDGEYLMIPAMVVRLREVGYVGAQPEDFEGLMPLAAVARHLNPVASS